MRASDPAGAWKMVDVYNHVKHCTTHPKFLHSNSTSHRWVFGAIAELIDNAIDPDVSASQFCIDMKEFGGEPCLVFMDNGCGLVPEKLHKMLSFGHSKKQTAPGDKSIGKHGNGFKSGTMRLGNDVLVLTKCADSMTAGFLSQTFLADTAAEDILIPQVSWDLNGNRLSPMDLEIEESLRAICKFSIFPDEESLLAQLEAIPVTGAILIISNLRKHEGVLELDFETDPHDIRITSEISSSYFQQLRPNQPNTTEVPMDYSLRAYVSILYKVPRMQVFIRDKKVKTKRIAGILSQKEVETYKPSGVAESIKIELGFNTENKNLYGMMLYHRNRLIKAYMRVGMQLEENERGMGVLGLAEADFLQPTHNKQDFDDTTAYRRLLKKLSDVLGEYWWEKKERVQQALVESRTLRRGINVSSAEDIPDVIWVQCDNPTCLKWRILPFGTDVAALPDIWYCEYHPEERFQRHEEPEQEWDPSVQHEIVERRRERKREYDREKKEREAERKRQRLEAVSKDNQEALQKQREKEVQLQEARGESAQKVTLLHTKLDLRMREEKMKKLSEEYAALLSKRDELSRQIEHAEAELSSKDKAEEGTAAPVPIEPLPLEDVAEEPAAAAPIPIVLTANGHAEQPETTSASTARVDHLEGGSGGEDGAGAGAGDGGGGWGVGVGGGTKRGRRGGQDREKVGRSRLGAAQNSAPPPISTSPTTRARETAIDVNGDVQIIEVNELGRPPYVSPTSTTRQEAAAAAAADTNSPQQRPREEQFSLQPALMALSKELATRGASGATPSSQRRGSGSSAAVTRSGGLPASSPPEPPRRRSTKSGRAAAAGLSSSTREQQQQQISSTQRLDSRAVVSPSAAATTTPLPAAAALAPPPLPVQQGTNNRSDQTGTAAVLYSNDLNHQQTMDLSTASAALEDRSSESAQPAYHQDLPLVPLTSNGSFSEHTECAVGAQMIDPTSLETNLVNGRHSSSATGAPLSGLRLVPPIPNNSPLNSGMISVHLPMDSMVSTSNSRSEAEITLDKAVFSLQRRLRLTLNTLLKLGGSGEANLIELDGLPSQDNEVVSICEKANQRVESMFQNGRQEVAKLKAELAYLMADKMQHGQGRNFKIQSIANKWGIGMEFAKPD